MAYDPGAFEPFAVTVDLVVLTIRDDELCVLTVERGEEPYAGQRALPGGFVLPDEDLETAALRELGEETGLSAADVHLEQLRSYGAPARDPRMRVVSVAHLALAPDLPTPQAGTDAVAASWVPVPSVGPLAFDHDDVLRDGLERARAKLEYSPLATAFCPPEFTIGELRRVYEVVWGVTLDPRNFHRKATATPGFLVATGERTNRQGGRPAELYRPGVEGTLLPPMTRPSQD